MGFFPLSLTLLLAATPIPVDAPRLQDDAAPVLEQAMAPEAFEAVLLEGNIPALQLACADAAQFGDSLVGLGRKGVSQDHLNHLRRWLVEAEAFR